jgi:cytoskeletal protein RodZ
MGLLKRRNLWMIGMLVLLEGGALLLFAGRRAPGGTAAPKLHDSAQSSSSEKSQESELLIGEFSVSNDHADKGRAHSPSRVELKVFAIVEESNREQFDDIHRNRKYRIQEAVADVVRRAGAAELTDIHLTVLKASIQRAINQCLGQPLLTGVAVTDYQWRDE